VNIVLGYFDLRDQLREFALMEKSPRRRRNRGKISKSSTVERYDSSTNTTPQDHTRFAEDGPALAALATRGSAREGEELYRNEYAPQINCSYEDDAYDACDAIGVLGLMMLLWVICYEALRSLIPSAYRYLLHHATSVEQLQ